MAEITDHLEIEKLLEARSKEKSKDFFRRYQNLKRDLLDGEYMFTMHRFAGGNDHGPEHIKRALDLGADLFQVKPKARPDLEAMVLALEEHLTQAIPRPVRHVQLNEQPM